MKVLRLTIGVLLLVQVGTAGCGDDSQTVAQDGGMLYAPGPTCTAFCAKVIGECEAFPYSEVSCQQGCEQNLADELLVSDACEDAAEAVFQCVAALDCAGVAGWAARVPFDAYPCRATVLAYGEACPQG